LYKSFSELCVFAKLYWLIKICLNKTYTKIWIGLHLSGTFPIQDGVEQDVLITIRFSILL